MPNTAFRRRPASDGKRGWSPRRRSPTRSERPRRLRPRWPACRSDGTGSPSRWPSFAPCAAIRAERPVLENHDRRHEHERHQDSQDRNPQGVDFMHRRTRRSFEECWNVIARDSITAARLRSYPRELTTSYASSSTCGLELRETRLNPRARVSFPFAAWRCPREPCRRSRHRARPSRPRSRPLCGSRRSRWSETANANTPSGTTAPIATAIRCGTPISETAETFFISPGYGRPTSIARMRSIWSSSRFRRSPRKWRTIGSITIREEQRCREEQQSHRCPSNSCLSRSRSRSRRVRFNRGTPSLAADGFMVSCRLISDGAGL